MGYDLIDDKLEKIIKIYLNNPLKYKVLKNDFKNNDISKVNISYEYDSFFEAKSKIINILNNLYIKGNLNEEEIKKYKECYFTINKLLAILLMDNEDFIYFLNLENICGMDSSDFKILLKKFISDYDIINGYDLSDSFIKNIESLEKILSDEKNKPFVPKYLNNVKINKDFEDLIIHQIPESFDELEKAYYVYYLLCKNLTYDEEQFLSKTKHYNEYSIDHCDITRLGKINEKNNRIICFEFVAIYAKILEKLGITFSIVGSKKYADGHVYLLLFLDKYKIIVDSTHSIVNSDMTLSKNYLRLNGFVLKDISNYNLEEINEYKNHINNVYSYIEKNENIKHLNSMELQEQNKKIFSKYLNIPVDKRINILSELLKQCNLPIMDNLYYLHNIANVLFNSNEFELFYVKNNLPSSDEKLVSVTVVFVYNQKNIYNIDTNRYFISDDFNVINEISLSDLKKYFKNKKYEIKDKNNDKIPGIHKKLQIQFPK